MENKFKERLGETLQMVGQSIGLSVRHELIKRNFTGTWYDSKGTPLLWVPLGHNIILTMPSSIPWPDENYKMQQLMQEAKEEASKQEEVGEEA